MNLTYILEQYEAVKRFALYGLAMLGLFYLAQMTETLKFINVVVPSEVVEELPKAAVVKSKY